ncbi:MAG TPA: LytTR family DNA-binding domain-containing protein [Bacillota bacterium]|nr:LytTR family DNA-binding domain-containing protein [Bacillota bacterium]
MKLILVDDEKPILAELSFILRQMEDVQIIGEFTNPALALEAIANRDPDAVFLDIEMPELDGFTVAEEILNMKKPIGIVFATAYDEYAVKAFDINAVDYILKPFISERLARTIEKLRNYQQQEAQKRYQNYRATVGQQLIKRGIRKIPLWHNGRIVLINPQDILYYVVEKDEVSIIVKENMLYQSQEPLQYWEGRLREHKFFRCHRNYLINLEKVEEILPAFHSTFTLKLKGVLEEIPVSRNYVKDFRNILGL